MKTILTSCLLLLGIRSLPAQNWAPFSPGDTAVYRYHESNPAREVLDWAIVFDSMSTNGGDTLWYPYAQLDPQYVDFQDIEFCGWKTHGTGWTGPAVVQKASGVWEWENNLGEILHFEPHTVSPYHFLDRADGSYFMLFPGPRYQGLVLSSLTDSLQDFGIQYYDSAGGSAPHWANGKNIVLSKAHGLVTSLDWGAFPDSLYRNLSLEGWNQTGRRVIGAGEIWDFQPGDSLDVYQESMYFGLGYKVWYRFIYLQRSLDASGDTLIYEVVRKTCLQFFEPDSSGHDYSVDTLTEKYGDVLKPGNSRLNRLPGQSDGELSPPRSGSLASLDLPVLFYNTDYNGRTQRFDRMDTYLGTDSCLMFVYVDFDPRVNEFIEGLGGPYYGAPTGGLEEFYRELIFYDKGGETWGTPFDCDALTSRAAALPEPQVRLFPNPASDRLSMEYPAAQGARLELFDLYGRTVLHTELPASGHHELDAAALPPTGLYLYRISLPGFSPATGKLRVNSRP